MIMNIDIGGFFSILHMSSSSFIFFIHLQVIQVFFINVHASLPQVHWHRFIDGGFPPRQHRASWRGGRLALPPGVFTNLRFSRQLRNQIRNRKYFTPVLQGGYWRCLGLTMNFKGDRDHHITQRHLFIFATKKQKQHLWIKSTALCWRENEEKSLPGR